MEDGNEQAKEPWPQRRPHRPDRSEAWIQLTCDYLRDLLRQLDDAAALLEADDPIGIQHFAHRAKGTSGTYGLALISEQFARLEQAAGNHPREHIARLLGAIRRLIQVQIEKLDPGVASSGRGQNGNAHG